MLKNPATKYRPIEAVIGDVALKTRTWPDKKITKAPIWLSTDLRDGNQALIEPMNLERKLKMFDLLVQIGFKEIEVGFPSASQTDFDFVRLLIESGRIPDDVRIQALTPAREPLIRRTFEALQGAKNVIVHFYNATAPVMRRVVFNLDQQQVLDELAVAHAKLIKQLMAEQPGTNWLVEYSPEMFSGTELAFSKRIVDAVSAVFEPTPEKPLIINLPATVEHSMPNVYADMIEWMHLNLERRDSLLISLHPHNDRGTGTAAAELGLMAGADRVEGCLFGNGERTGNVDVVNLALNMYIQGIDPELDFSDIDAVRATVEYCNQLPVHPRHPYVGDLVFTSFSGSHQDAIKKAFAARKPDGFWDMPYLPIDPPDLGRSYEAVIRVNSQSGKGGIAYLLESEYGLSLPRRLQIEFSSVVQGVTDASGKEVSAAEIHALFKAEYLDAAQPYAYVAHHLVEDSKADRVQLATELQVKGVAMKLEGQGNGPIDAFVAGLAKLTGQALAVVDYHEHAVSAGSDAKAVTYIELKIGNATRATHGVGIDGNIVTASLKAILSALNRAAR
ncbi:MAG: 2-isopropylmalate synthase [Pseudomonadota bacterium]